MRGIVLFIWFYQTLTLTVQEQEDCGGVISNQSTGTIKSPAYSKEYADNLNCTWIVEVSVNMSISLTFIEFELEDESSCAYDYLEVRNGNSLVSPILAKLCGSEIPTTIQTTSRYLTLHFVTDGRTTEDGFKASFAEKQDVPEAIFTINEFSTITGTYIRPIIRTNYIWVRNYSSSLNYDSASTSCGKRDFIIKDRRDHCFKDEKEDSGAHIFLLIDGQLSMRISREHNWRTITVTTQCLSSGHQLQVETKEERCLTNIFQEEFHWEKDGCNCWESLFFCRPYSTTSASFGNSTTSMITTVTNNSSEVNNVTMLTSSTTSMVGSSTSYEQKNQENGEYTTQSTDNQVRDGNSHIGGIVGGTISGVILIIVIVVVVFIICKRRKKLSNSEDDNQTVEYSYVNSEGNGATPNGESEYNVLHERVRLVRDDTYQVCDYGRTADSNAADQVSYHFVDLPEQVDSLQSDSGQAPVGLDKEDDNTLHNRVTQDQTYQDEGAAYAEVTPRGERIEASDRVSYHMADIPQHERVVAGSESDAAVNSNNDEMIYENTEAIAAADASYPQPQIELNKQTEDVDMVENDLYEGAQPDDADDSVVYSLAGEA